MPESRQNVICSFTSLIPNGLVISPSPHPVWFPEKGGDKHLALDLHFPPT